MNDYVPYQTVLFSSMTGYQLEIKLIYLLFFTATIIISSLVLIRCSHHPATRSEFRKLAAEQQSVENNESLIRSHHCRLSLPINSSKSKFPFSFRSYCAAGYASTTYQNPYSDYPASRPSYSMTTSGWNAGTGFSDIFSISDSNSLVARSLFLKFWLRLSVFSDEAGHRRFSAAVFGAEDAQVWCS